MQRKGRKEKKEREGYDLLLYCTYIRLLFKE